MNFTSNNDIFIKPFINAFGKCNKPKISKETTSQFNTILISLYQDMYEASTYVFKNVCFKHRTINLHTNKQDAILPEINNGKYYPKHIKDYITTNEKYQLIFTCKNIGNREINIIFTLFSEKELQNINVYLNRVKMMYMWLHICSKYSDKNCSQSLSIHIYLTPFIKKLPTESTTIIGPAQVNTAFTYACLPKGLMMIFREEEWFKVFLHETFHSYGLDFANHEDKHLKDTLKKIFPINSEFSIYEAYTETWGRIINCAFSSFNTLENKKDKNTFLQNMKFCLELERMFAMYQCNKILGFMGLKYENLHKNNNGDGDGDGDGDGETNKYLRKNLYREDTHVFAYYVMTSIFLNDHPRFLVWCKNHNKVLLQFDRSSENFKAFAEYIKQIYKCDSYKNGINYMTSLIENIKKNSKNKQLLLNSTRMSIVDMV